MPTRLLRFYAAIALLYAATNTACAGQSHSSGLAEGTGTGTASTSSIITAEELAQHTSPSTTALQAIQKLRPGYLNYRGQIGFKANTGVLQVSLDGGQLGTQDILAILPVSNIASIRFYSAADATQKFGTASANGPVIEVRQK